MYTPEERECIACRYDWNVLGMLADYCPVCGTDRRAGSEWWAGHPANPDNNATPLELEIEADDEN